MLAVRLWLVACVWLLASGCTRNDQTHQIRGEAFGAPVQLSLYGVSEQRAQQLGQEVLDEFARLHGKFHAWKPSELTALNEAIARGEPYRADAEMVALLQAAARLADESDNLFNPAVGRLIRLWGFQASQIVPHQPDPAEITRLVQARPRMSDLRFDGNTISSVNPQVMLDLGGYAKGYALDQAARLLRKERVPAALINVGGNILAIGQPGNRPWTVGIQNPRGDGVIAAVPLHDNEAIGTSGDYQRYYMQDGKRRPHIIDPRTGETTNLVAAATIIISGGDAVGTRSDGYTKPLFVAGPTHWQDMAQRLGLREVMLIDAQGNVTITSALQQRMAMQPARAH